MWQPADAPQLAPAGRPGHRPDRAARAHADSPDQRDSSGGSLLGADLHEFLLRRRGEGGPRGRAGGADRQSVSAFRVYGPTEATVTATWSSGSTSPPRSPTRTR